MMGCSWASFLAWRRRCATARSFVWRDSCLPVSLFWHQKTFPRRNKRYLFLITFRVTSLEETDFESYDVVSALWRSSGRTRASSDFADVFADSRLVSPPKCLMIQHQGLE